MKKILFLTGILSVLFSSCKKNDDMKVADELKFSANFTEDDHLWYTDATHVVVPGENGYYSLSQTQSNYQTWGIAPYATINYNYAIAAEVKITSYNLGAAGLIYNFIDNDHYYVFYILNDGTYYAFKKAGTVFTNLVSRTFSSAIKNGTTQKNYVEVRQSGNTAYFVVNGVQISSCQSSRGYRLVRAGVALSTITSPMTGDFDNVRISKIQ